MTELLTHSRIDAFKTCRKKAWYAYEHGIRSVIDGRALRMGSAYHAGIEALTLRNDLAAGVQAVRDYYLISPDEFDEYAWAIERETVIRLLCGYEWRWQQDGLEYVEVELSVQLPLTNPVTGKKTPSFELAGKIDAIVKLPDGRLAVKESKLLGDDLGPDSGLWRRLRIDSQISQYVIAARKLGYKIDSVLYDATRKPTIAATAVPVLDDLGAKIVEDVNGNRVKTERGLWRQTGDKDKGYTLRTRPMTPEEWGEKLNDDIAERPEFYFQRHEVARLDGDLAEYEAELWDIQQTYRDAQKSGRWYRTANRNTCEFCPVFDLCTVNFDPTRNDLPGKFVKLSDIHPELKGTQHVDRNESPVVATITDVRTADIAAESRSTGFVSYF